MQGSSFYKENTLPGIRLEKPMGMGNPPSHIGRYKVEGYLSRGGMSVIYLGLHPETKELMAIKVLSPELTKREENRAQFLQEAKIITLASHPNIVKIYDEGEWENGVFICMELLKGISLRQFIAQASFSLNKALDILLQISHALLHLHSHGIVHRDIKPENIIIQENGQIKLVDFGIAIFEQAHQIPHEASDGLVGTPSYMSPEQRQSPRDASFSSDIYSLGVIAYELILGKFSYGVLNLALIPPRLRKIVEKCVAVSKELRYHDIVDFITDINSYLKSTEIEKEKTHTDQIREIFERFEEIEEKICVNAPPKWELAEIGFAKGMKKGRFGFFSDFRSLPGNCYNILFAKTEESTLYNACPISFFAGNCFFSFFSETAVEEGMFHPQKFLETLHQIWKRADMGISLSLAMLTFDPLREELVYTSFGKSHLYHLPRESQTIRQIENVNPFFSKDLSPPFYTTRDRFEEGDVVTILFDVETRLETIEKKMLENRYRIAQRQAEELITLMPSDPSSFPVCATIGRIA